jgi:mannose-6-phosphate isomerase-like protein (cupin superfamily)
MAMQLDEAQAILLGPGEGERLPGKRRELRVKYEGGEFDVLEFWCEQGFGPIEPHVHEDHTDSFFVLEGEVEFTIGDETVRAGPGTWLAAPPGVRHGFSIPGPDGARFLNIHAPGTGFVDLIRSG